ncbi:flavodoxin [Eggerthella sinensis]|uniref:flavodoxin n=1 Tax=Eggerthella sinensis TaxID=242230 RepID=UPI00248E06F5|nr:flavodoxin [Eggerthella sinensis]
MRTRVEAIDRRAFVRMTAIAGATLFSGFMIAGCSQQTTETEPAEEPSEESNLEANAADATAPQQANQLVAYFSCPEPTGVDTVAGASRVVVENQLYGNVEYVASLIQEHTGADVFVVDTVQEYPADHDELIEFAVAEMDAGTLPELAEPIADISSYDRIFLGYPIWNAQLPMPVRSLLEGVDLSGKAVVCFTVHGGSGFGGTIDQVRAAEPSADITEGFSVSRNSVGGVASDVASWLNSLPY